MNQINKESKSRIIVKKKKKSKKKRIFIYILIFLLLVIGGITAYVVSLWNKAEDVANESYESDGREKSDYRDTIVDPAKDHVSILFVGIDSSEKRNNGTHALSDALILATLNIDDKSVKMLSIPRDSYVYMPDTDEYDKITHAHGRGIKATIETVENLLEVPVDYYVRLNFNAFVDVVDSLGGITVDVPYEFSEQDSNDSKNAIHLEAGIQELNGEEALALARTRKLDNDIERGKRQQEIMKAIAKKVASVDSLLKLDESMEAVGKNMSTNLTFSEMQSLVKYGLSSELDIETLNLSGTDLWTNRYYLQLNEEDLLNAKAILKNHLELEGTSDNLENTTEVQ
ncbi:LCP family protein [Gracilibacillus marinus]|uniref:LCP family protein n=1 Tax=Gracilibacillus marinus TaxID=630535 RepID=A0ABV8VQ12_9BACI